MTKKLAIGLICYVLAGIGLLVAAHHTTFSHGFKEFCLGVAMGCVGIGLVFGGCMGAMHAIWPPVVYATADSTTVPEVETPIGVATDVAMKMSLTFGGFATVLCGIGFALLLPFGCCR